MIELLVIGGTLTIAAWAAGAQAHRRFLASRALDRYAQSRGLRFIPAPTRDASPRVLGSKDDVDYVVDLYKLGEEVRTRVSGVITRGARTPVLSVGQRDAFRWKKQPDVASIGDAAFDAAYVVTTIGNAEDVESLKTTVPSLLILDAARRGVWLYSDGAKVWASWQGMESDPVMLDAARDAVVMVASWHRPESPYR